MGAKGAAEKSQLSTSAGPFDTTVNGSISIMYQFYNESLVGIIKSIIIHGWCDLETGGGPSTVLSYWRQSKKYACEQRLQ